MVHVTTFSDNEKNSTYIKMLNKVNDKGMMEFSMEIYNEDIVQTIHLPRASWNPIYKALRTSTAYSMKMDLFK